MDIGFRAFDSCKGLTNVTIPNSVKSIGRSAFAYCEGLKTVISEIEEPFMINSDVFYDTNFKLIVPDGTKAAYQATEGWKKLKNIEEGDSNSEIRFYNFWYHFQDYKKDMPTYLKDIISVIPGNDKKSLIDPNYTEKGEIPEGCTEGALVMGRNGGGIEWSFYEGVEELLLNLHFTGKRTFKIRYTLSNGDSGEKEVSYKSGTYTKVNILEETELIDKRLDIRKLSMINTSSTGEVRLYDMFLNMPYHIYNSTCGVNVYYSYDRVTHTLTISGEGNMRDYIIIDDDRPWKSFAENIQTLIIEPGVTSIGSYAFRNCTSLASVTIPESVTTIDSYAFDHTPWLENQPDGVIYINKIAYKYKGEMPDNTSIIIEPGTIAIGDGAFSGCMGLTSVTIPNSVTSIGNDAFFGCTGLTSINIPNSVTTIGYYAFKGCISLNSVTIPGSVTSLGEWVFWGCTGLTSVEISKGVKTISNAAFVKCKGLTSVTIPNSVKNIDANAFWQCTSLTSVTIPESVTEFGEGAFAECTGLTSVISRIKTPFAIHDNVFETVRGSAHTSATLIVPVGTKALYQATAGWDQFQNIVEADEEIIDPTPEKETLIAVQNWEGNTGDYPLWFWAGVEKTDGTSVSLEAEGLAINNSRSQEKMWIPQAIVLGRMPTIEKGHDYIVRLTVKVPADGTYYVFLGSWDGFYDEYDVPVKTSERFQVIDIKFPNYVNTIAEGTGFVLLRSGLVVGTTIIKKVEVYDLTDSKDDSYVDGIHYKFDVESLTAEVLPTSQKYEGDIVIPTAVMNDGKVYTVTRIGNIAFMNCKDIISVTIPNTVETIGMNAFEGCTNLRVIRIGKGVKEIGGGAFSGISGNPGTRAEGKGIDVYCYSETVPKTATDAFKGTSLEASTLHVPATAVEAYKATWPWSDFKDIVAIEEDPDGIMGVRKSADGSGDYYDLTGRKALKLRKGLYVRNGKKIIVR